MNPALLQALPASPAAALTAAFVAGLLSVLTPCVLPMIPITLATVGVTRAASRGRALLTAGAYAAGIVLTFTALGIAFALTGTLFGSLLAHPATAVILAAIFVAMAASCFELLPFRLPEKLTQTVARFGGKGPPGAFAAGLVAGFVAAPCIGPVLAAILSYVATTRNVPYGALLLATYGLGFGLPFLLVGAFALRLPKAGAWMVAVKRMFGVAMLVGAYWILRGAFPALRWEGHLTIGIFAAIAGLLLLATVTMRESRSVLLHLGPTMLAISGGVLIINAVLEPKLRWCAQSAEASCLSSSCGHRQRTIVVYTAAWCPACHELENETLADPAVTERLSQYGRVIVDVDANEELAAKANISGMPTVIVYDDRCQEAGRNTGYVPRGDFLRWLDSIEK